MTLDTIAVRRAMAQLPEVASQESLQPPRSSGIYVPQLHVKALRVDISVVSGMRGAGKSWWTAVLADDATRALAADLVRDEGLHHIIGRVGFGLDERNTEFPNRDTIDEMQSAGLKPTEIWWAVVMHHALGVAGGIPADYAPRWVERARRWAADTSARDEQLSRCDEAVTKSGKTLVILLDSLDRVGGDWDRVRELTRAALEVCLRLRSRRSIRSKLFLRPDLEEDDRIWAFPDSSKLRQGTVRLDWPTADLYGLLWSILANTPGTAKNVRPWLAGRIGPLREVGTLVSLPVLGQSQMVSLMEELASPYMGTSRKRGLTWSWMPLHLADARGRVTPRSWLLAFQRAAEVTEDQHPDHDRALHYEGIQQGVVAASEIRVQEIAEDHPWVRPLLEAAGGLAVPCEPVELLARWQPRDLPMENGARLPPRRFSTDPVRAGDPAALIDDLAALGVLYRTEDGRVNIPDIFRVGFRIKRKGGVRPPR